MNILRPIILIVLLTILQEFIDINLLTVLTAIQELATDIVAFMPMHGFLPRDFYVSSRFFLGFGSSDYDHRRSFWRWLSLGSAEHARLEQIEIFEYFLGIHVLELLVVHGLLFAKVELFQWTLGSRVEV